MFIRSLRHAFILFSLSLIGCKKNSAYSPEDCMPVDVQKGFLQTMVHYSSKLAPEATHATKFDPAFDWYYTRAVKECKIMFCDFRKQDSTYRVFVAREARSITPMKEGIAVEVQFDNHGGFKKYNEVFRMWKMPEDTLARRGKFLFSRMIKGEDLSLYYTKFQQDRFIEYPDDRFTFDTVLRRWQDNELDTLRLN